METQDRYEDVDSLRNSGYSAEGDMDIVDFSQLEGKDG